MKAIRAPILQVIRENRKNPIISATAELCDKFLRAYHNEDITQFDKNGELRVLSLAASRLPQDRFVALDIGANKGDWTQALLDHRPDSKIVCFEMLPDVAAALKTRYQDFPAVEVFNIGLSSEAGEVAFYWNKGLDVTSSILPQFHGRLFRNITLEKLTRSVQTGDYFVESLGLPKIDFMKIDVEGHEVDVLKGFSKTLANNALCPAVIQFEYGSTFIPSRHRLIDIYELLLPHEYMIGRIYPTHVDFKDYVSSDDHFRMGNYLAVQESSGLQELLRG